MAQRSRPKSGQSNRKASTSRAPAPPSPASSGEWHEPSPADQAVARFEAAMQALQRHRYVEAAERFQSILEEFPAERGLGDRSHVYLDLCARELQRSEASPNPTRVLSIEERLTEATAALNDDNEDRAERLARQVLGDAPTQDLALYLMAAVAARRGQRESSLSWLARAVEANPEIRVQARHDEDFMVLHEDPSFRRLIDPPAAPSRPVRKGRPER